MKHCISLASIVVLMVCGGVFAQPVGTTSYHSILGDTFDMNVWQGNKISVLTPTATTYNNSTMSSIVSALDKAYDYYYSAVGEAPANFPAYMRDGRMTIASVSPTGGAGYSWIGSTGIELETGTFNVLYNGVKNNNEYDQVAFYEFGRNFWTNKLGARLNGGNPNGPTIGQYTFTTGFAVFMRFKSMEYAQLNGAPFGSWTFTQFKNNVLGLVDQYTADHSLNFANTLAVGKGVPGILGGTDLFASMIFRIGRDHGGETFFNDLWKEAAKLPTTNTDQGAIDNFFLASSYAANANLTSLFVNDWRWNISASAQAQAAAITAVPEPTALGFAMLTAPALLRRRNIKRPSLTPSLQPALA
jgi:hypothetical protein